MTHPLTVKVSSRNQISLPSRARQLLDIEPGDHLLVDIQGGALVLMPRPDDFVEALSGLGRELWLELDSDAYLAQERDAWNHSSDA